jgi:outer membrane receptor protein involved in Fe transport
MDMKKLFLFCSLIIAFSSFVWTQSQSTTGNIEGHVVDQNGAVVPNVSITATNVDTGFSKTAQSDADGKFVIVLLPPGKYRVETGAVQGFATSKYENVTVSVGGKTALEIALTIGAAANIVDVAAGGEAVETTRSSISTTVDEKAIDNLPVNGRSFLDFATLTPGVIRDPNRTGDLSVGGQKGTLNSLQIDGTSNDNTFFGQTLGRTGTGRAPFQFSIETVKEFQINQNGFSAEFGRAGGAIINVVTKSGTNDFFGSAFEYFRDESLNANSPLLKANLARAGRPNIRPPSQTNQFGGTFGGPFKKDKAFFFAAYDGQRSTLPNPIDLPSLATAPANVQALLGPKTALYNFDRKQDVFLFKTDFNLNSRNQLSIRFNQQNFVGKNNENAGSLSAEEHSGNSKVRTTTLTGSWTATITPTWFNEFRTQFSRDREPGEANSDSPELVVTTPNGNFNIGRNNFSPRETTVKRYQFVDNQTFLMGSHTIKYGADLLFDRIFNFFPGLFGGTYRFGSYTQLSAYLSNTPGTFPTSFSQNFPGAGTSGPETHPDSNEYGFFVQDDWRINRKATLNLGLRYDYQDIAKPPIQNPSAALAAAGYDTSFRPSDTNNFAPRFGISYAIDEKTVIRGGYGIFYARTPSIMTGTTHSQNGVQVIGISLTCSSTVICPTYPNRFASLPTGPLAAINLYLFDQNYQQPYVHQGRISFEREFFKNLTLSFAYTVYAGRNLTHTRDANFVAPVDRPFLAADTGQNVNFQRFNIVGVNPRPVAGFNRISLFESSGRSNYNGFSVEARRRFANRFSFIAAYTFSKAKDDKPDQTIVVVGTDDAKVLQNQFDVSTEYGRSDLDLKHRFVFSPVFEFGKITWGDNAVAKALLSDWVLSGIVQAQSGFAYSAAVTGNPNNDDNSSNDRLTGTLRNQFSTPSTLQVDARLSRSFSFGESYRLTLLGEGFNIFNRSNVSGVNNAYYAATFSNTTQSGTLTRTLANGSFAFGQPSRFLTERQFQLGIRFEF